MKRRYVWPLLGGVAVLVAVALFVAPVARARLLVDLVTGLSWPLALLVAAVVFWPQLQRVAEESIRRILGGAEFKLGFLSLSREANQIPSPPAEAPVGLAHVALLHTSFFRPDKTRRFDNGRVYFQIEVVVIAPSEVLNRISRVTYDLDDRYPPERRQQVSEDRRSGFKMKELAYGASIVRARLEIEGQEPVFLNRFIELRRSGPRSEDLLALYDDGGSS